MDIADMVSELNYQLMGMTDDATGEPFLFFALDIGEVFIKTPGGQFFKLGVDEITADDVSFIEADDWS